MSASTEFVKGKAYLLILTVLVTEDMHGYRIAREIDRISEGYFVMGEGTLYPHLHRLEEDGLIEGYWETDPGGRERKSYRISDKGRAELERRTQEWKQFQTRLNSALGLAFNAV